MRKILAVLTVAMFAMVVLNFITSKLWQSGKPVPVPQVAAVQKKVTPMKIPVVHGHLSETFQVTGSVSVGIKE